MRRYAIAVLCVILILATPAAPLPYPGANDAGTGRDAGDYSQVATPLGPGSYEAEVGRDVITPVTSVAWWEYDYRDVYRLDVPASSAIRVDIEIPDDAVDDDSFLIVSLEGPRGPDGPVTTVLSDLRRSGNMTVGTVGGGTWNLSFQDEFHRGPQSYRFSVAYQSFDHAAVLDGRGAGAAAWRIDIPSGVQGIVDAWLPLGDGPPPDRTTEDAEGERHFFSAWFQRHPTTGCLDTWSFARRWEGEPAIGRNGADGEDILWTDGLPHDIGAGSPADIGEVSDQRGRRRHVLLDVQNGNGTARGAIADFDGVNEIGHVLWNGPGAPAIESIRAEAEFLTLQDFESQDGGLGAQLGPAAYARSVVADVTVPEDLDANVVFASAVRPSNRNGIHTPLGSFGIPYGVSTPTMEVDLPNGTSRELTDELFYWMPLAVSPHFEDVVDQNVPAGPWRFHLDQVDGLEGDQVRVMRLGFGFPFECPA